MDTKKCSTCQEVKTLDNFSPDASRPGQSQRQCKGCRAAYMKKYNARNKERINLRVKLSKSSLTSYEYGDLLEKYPTCAICEKSCKTGKALAIDHDHRCCQGKKSCGKCIRGLLCQDCNLGLGHFRDNPNSLMRAIDYLRKE